MKKLKKLLTMFLTICMLASSMAVYADYNGTGNNDSGSDVGHGSGVTGGASWRKTGIVIYMLDTETGGVITNSDNECVWLVPNGVSANNVEHAYFKTRIGEMNLPYNPVGCSMPSPILWNDKAFVQNYDALHAWLTQGTGETIDSPDPKMYLRLVNKYFRPEYDKAVAEGKKISLCIEGVAWHDLFTSLSEKSGTGTEFISTAIGWAKAKKDNDVTGSTFTDKMDNEALAQLMKLEYRQFGWKTPFTFKYYQGRVNNDDIIANAYGINIVNLSAPIPSTKTPTPAPMKSDNGTYSVIKCYEDIIPPVEGAESAEPQYQHKASYINTKAPERLYIESEEEYTVTDWEVIKEKVENINPSDSYDAITSGKTPTNTGNGDSEVDII